MITEAQLKENPRMAALVEKALSRDFGNASAEFRKRKTKEALSILLEGEVPQNKYHIADKEDRIYTDGELFASKREMERWDFLLKVQMAGEIKDLRKQVPYMLQEAFEHPQYGKVNHIMYVADFDYYNISFRKEYKDRTIVEDSKGGVRTPEYRNKRKMFLYRYPHLLFFEV